jgi:hypothetical protein
MSHTMVEKIMRSNVMRVVNNKEVKFEMSRKPVSVIEEIARLRDILEAIDDAPGSYSGSQADGFAGDQEPEQDLDSTDDMNSEPEETPENNNEVVQKLCAAISAHTGHSSQALFTEVQNYLRDNDLEIVNKNASDLTNPEGDI